MRIKDDQKRLAILKSATNLIVKNGLSSVTTAKVARAAGLVQSNLYIYFSSKEVLLATVFQTTQEQLAGYLQQQLADVETPAEQLEIYMRALYQYSIEHPEQVQLLQQFAVDPILQTLPVPIQQRQAVFNAPNDFLSAGIKAGVFRKTAAPILQTMISTTLLTYARAVTAKQLDPVKVPLEQILTLLKAAVLI
ncbi:TetR/AcrR family transcriptional regulator [Loigolactobacillus iwatensis]|uniref:TetR/AcrR family transcriptional regulator n=1 Tax=Loigolactobacillus iwatensis TaxID=1267156 RepID=UPI000F7EF1B7|nr:TetR/AcrR family transcriptional regulator [Loigolactobacillus iwatensis]